MVASYARDCTPKAPVLADLGGAGEPSGAVVDPKALSQMQQTLPYSAAKPQVGACKAPKEPDGVL